MYRENKSDTIKIYYKSDNLASGQTVVFSIWDSNGNTYSTGTVATSEISNLGVYYLNFNTPAIDTYLLVKAGYSNGTFMKSLVIQVGFPDITTLFYVDGTFREGLNLPFTIFDIIGSVYLVGQMWPYGHGFYGTNVSTLKENTYFLRVPPEAMKFTIPILYENGIPMATGHGGASKARHSVFDYEGEMTKRKIHAKLITDDEPKGMLVNLKKEEDQKTSVVAQLIDADKEWDEKWAGKENVRLDTVKPVLKKDGNDKKFREKWSRNAKQVNTGYGPLPKSNGINPDLNKSNYIDKTNIVNKTS